MSVPVGEGPVPEMGSSAPSSSSSSSSSPGTPEYSIILVDDEAVVREGIRDRIDWSALGYRLVGVHENGRAARDAVRASPPDVVLTDIRMPFLDGIELTRSIAEEFPAVRVLLLTGHDEFEYAQEAVRLQVWDFLLKPISSRELTDVLRRLREDLDTDAARRDREERLRRQWNENLPLLRERAFNDLLLSDHPLEEAFARLRELDVVVPGGRTRLVLVSPDPPDDTERNDGLRSLAIANLVREMVREPMRAFQFTTRNDNVALLLSGPDGDLMERLDHLRRAVTQRLGGSVTVAVGPAYGRPQDVRRSFQGARTRLLQRFVTGGNRIVVSELEARPSESAVREHSAIRSELMVQLRNVNRDGCRRMVDALIELCRSEHTPVAVCILNLQRDVARIIEGAEALDVPTDTFLSETINPFQELAEQPSLEEIRRWFHGLLDRLMDALEERVSTQAEVKVRAAEAYIREHFHEPGLSLTGMCADLSVSVSHFSRRFKEITGRTFVEYLTDVRMEQAKELLRTGRGKGYEIAPQVGIRDPHYFSSTFKKVCGMTPTEYRRHYGVSRP